MPNLPEHLLATAREQQNLLTRAQLYGAGVTSAQIRWALGRDWRGVHPDVFLLATGRVDPAQRLVAAALFAGDGAQVGSTTAARYFGLSSVPDDGVARLFVPWGAKSRERPGVSVRRTRRPDPRPWSRGPLSFTSPARTVVDAARQLRGDAVRAVVFEAVQRRMVTVEQLAAEVEAGAIRGSAAVRAAVLEVSGGAWSLPESEFADCLASSRVLPEVLLNPVLTTLDGLVLPSPDGYVEEVGLALQVHSRRHHLLEDDWESTLRTDTALGAVGVPLMAFSPRTLRAHPSRVLAAVERAYLSLRGRPRPPVLARARQLVAVVTPMGVSVGVPSARGARRGPDGAGTVMRDDDRDGRRARRTDRREGWTWTASRSSCCGRWRSGTSASSGSGSPTSSGR